MLKRQLKSKKCKVIVEMTVEEKERLVKLAKRYALGNISAWVRYSTLNLKPKRKDYFDL